MAMTKSWFESFVNSEEYQTAVAKFLDMTPV